MKKIFSLLMLIVALVTTQGAYAQKTYEISKTTKTADNGGTWTFVSEKQTFTVVNMKGKGYGEGSTDAISDPYIVEVVKNTVKAKRIVFDNSMFTLTANVKGVSNSKLTGNEGTDAEGYWIELNKYGKDFSTGSDIAVDGKTYKSIKGSNGAENILHLPNGVKVSRIIFYSYVNDDGTKVTSACGWKDVNGTQEYKNIPMESLQDAKNPDVRVYSIADDATQIAFNNAGYQLCFVYALDIVDETEATTTDITLSPAKTLSLSFGETNGINAVENNAEQNGAYYTLSGQQTVKPVKGLYIHNGKKYIAK